MLDRVLPTYGFVDQHATFVAASRKRTYHAVKEATAGEMPLVLMLFGLRSVPARLTGHGGLPSGAGASLYDQLVDGLFTVLADEPGREIVVGAINQPWKLAGGEARTLRDADEFVTFDGAGFVKLAMAFRFEPRETGTYLVTETRMQPTDPRSHRRFVYYWNVIRPGSGLVRRSWLSAAKRRAESR